MTTTTLTDTTLTHPELLNVTIAAWFTPGRKASAADADNDEQVGSGPTWGLPLLFWDEPGTGKTSALEALGRVCGFDVVTTIALNNRQPEDVGGYSIPTRTRDAMIKVPDAWVSKVNAAKRAVVLFDEFTVSEEHQAAALRVFSERMAGETRIGGHVRLAAMANPPSCAATAHEMTPPNANRFGHATWVGYDVDEFADWLLGGAGEQEIDPIDPVAHEARVLAAWPAAMAKAAALVKGYLRRFPSDLHQMPQGDGKTPKAGETDTLRWPSRRVWEMVARALASAQVHHLTDVETDAFVGFYLPAGVATRFATFRAAQDIAEPGDYLDGKAEFVINAKIDRTYAILEMTASYLANKATERREERAARWWQMATEVMGHKHGGKDFVVPAAKLMCRPESKGGAGLGKEVVPEAEVVARELVEVLLAERAAKISAAKFAAG
jgi:MoxR-like ATPase